MSRAWPAFANWLPAWRLRRKGPLIGLKAARRRVLPAGPVRVGVEAAVRQGWDRWLLGERGAEKKAAFIGMSSFGASAPYQDLYAHFGITAEAVAEAAKAML